jgi:hypothetical protein
LLRDHVIVVAEQVVDAVGDDAAGAAAVGVRPAGSAALAGT